MSNVRLRKINKYINEISLIGVIILLSIIFTILNSLFIQTENLINIVRQAVTNIIVVVGVTYVMTGGELDLSIGGTASLTGIIVAILLTLGIGIFLSIVLGLCLGALIGVINGLLTTKFKLNSIIVTLATMNIATGVKNLITGGTAVYGLPEEFGVLGRGYVGPIPLQVILMALVVVIGAVVMSKTTFGRYAFCVGGDAKVARLAGIKVDKYKILFFVVSGVLASFSGIISTSRLGSGQPNLASNMMMDAMTAVVIGGTTISGGRGSIIGSVLGALLLTIIANGLTVNGVNSFWQMIISAVILLATIITRRAKV